MLSTCKITSPAQYEHSLSFYLGSVLSLLIQHEVFISTSLGSLCANANLTFRENPFRLSSSKPDANKIQVCQEKHVAIVIKLI